MQDVNGDGLPNDEWYELKGSEYGKPETIQDYAVTYFRPGLNMDTPWQDNKGNTGAIDRLGNYHPQEFYYPLWIEADSYTLYGTCLKARTEQSPTTGMWSNNPFGWGKRKSGFYGYVVPHRATTAPDRSYLASRPVDSEAGSGECAEHIAE